MLAIAFAALGSARTTRQGRGLALGIAIVAVIAFRIAGFAASSALRGSPAAVVAVWGVPIGTIVVCWLLVFQAERMSPLLSGLKKARASLLGPRRTAEAT